MPIRIQVKLHMQVGAVRHVVLNDGIGPPELPSQLTAVGGALRL